MASQLLQNGKIKFFAPSRYDDVELLGPPPAYSAVPEPGSSTWQFSPATTTQRTQIQEALWAFQDRIQAAMTQNHQEQLRQGTEEDREVRRQLFHLMSDFLTKVSNDSPRSTQDLPASAHGILKADLYVAPQEAVPLSGGWHLSGFSKRDDEIIGRVVQEARVWPTETHSPKQQQQQQHKKKDAEANGIGSQSKTDHAAGLWSAVNALSLNEAVYEPRGTLWWTNEREAQEVARALDLPLAQLRRPCSSMSPGGNDHVQIKIGAEDMTFRRENEMGLWESKSGWTIVMAVTLFY